MGIEYNPVIDTNGLIYWYDTANIRSFAGSGNTLNSFVNFLVKEVLSEKEIVVISKLRKETAKDVTNLITKKIESELSEKN